MTDSADPARLSTSRIMLVAIVVVTAGLALVSSVLFQDPGLLGRDKDLVDFDAFYVAGLMADRGQAAETYRAADMMAEQRQFSGTTDFMPWTYLPPYLLLVQVLAKLPIGISFLAFFAATFGFFLLVVRRIAGEYLPGVLIAILPTILALARTGQNGFLTAGLVGLFLLAFLERRRSAGVPLGLMVLKPHLGAAIALLAVVDRRWDTVAIASGIVGAVLLAATVAYGLEIWPAFFDGLGDTSQFLAAGYYPLYRMSSIYAAVLAAGGSPAIALAVHGVGALAAVGGLVLAYVKRTKPGILAATACISSVFISPYGYDYDLAIVGIAMAFVLPEVLSKARRWEALALLLLSWAATGYGLAVSSATHGANWFGVAASSKLDGAPSLAGPLLVLLAAAGFTILRRQPVDHRCGLAVGIAR